MNNKITIASVIILVFLILSAIFSKSPEPDLEGWKTYQNEEFGYKVQYPRDWYLDPFPNNSIGFTSAPKKKYSNGGFLPPGETEVYVVLTENKNHVTIEKFIESNLKGTLRQDSDIVVVDGIKAHKEVYVFNIGPNAYYKSVAIYLSKDGLICKFLLHYWEGDPNEDFFVQTFYSILDTISLQKE